MTPAFRILVDGGQDVTEALRERLLSLRQRRGGLQLRYGRDPSRRPRRDAGLTVELGYDKLPSGAGRDGLKRGRVLMGRYTVDEVE